MIDKAILETEVIYEKTYPREDIEELHAKLSKEVDAQDRITALKMWKNSWKEILVLQPPW